MAPQLLQLVKLTHFGPEKMNNDIAGIDQHPITSCAAFNFSAAQSALSKHFNKMVCHRTYLAARLSGGDHHVIREARFVGQRYNDDIACLIIFELVLNQRKE